MSGSGRRLFGALVGVGVLLATTVAALAETCTLQPKRRETRSANDPTSSTYWTVQPQYFFVQMIADEKGRWRAEGADESAAAFKRLVKKEPKYASDHPYRGVLKLGKEQYAFALDAIPPPDAKQPEKKNAEQAAKKTSSLLAALAAAVAGTPASDRAATAGNPRANPAPVKDFTYNRLYFDFNHNGDLTDDKVVEISADSRRTVGYTSPDRSYRALRVSAPRSDDQRGRNQGRSFFLRERICVRVQG